MADLISCKQKSSVKGEKMAMTRSSKLHIAMFPWFAFGHFLPYLHLSNKLAIRGHKISFFLPRGTMAKLQHLNQHPHLIHFCPLDIPHVDGLPSGAETIADTSFDLVLKLWIAFDRTKDQVKRVLCTIKPDFVFYDVAYWIPDLAYELGFKSVVCAPVFAAWIALRLVPSVRIVKGVTLEELMQTPPGYPSSTVIPTPYEAALTLSVLEGDFGGDQLSFYDRMINAKEKSNAIAIRTYHELEGPFCDYISEQYGKPVLLTGPLLPEKPARELNEKMATWFSKFEAGSVVYCCFGSEYLAEKSQFQELLLGFELSGLPFFVALRPPQGCSTVEEALPEGFEDRVKERGRVYGGWVPQTEILKHKSVGCFVSHCGCSSLWESLLSDCQMVLVPNIFDQIVNALLMVKELKVAVEVNKEENGWISKEGLSSAIKLVMDKDSELGNEVKSNHAKWKKILSSQELQESYMDAFVDNLHDLTQ